MLSNFSNFLALTAVITMMSTVPVMAADGTKRVDIKGVMDAGQTWEDIYTPEEVKELEAINAAIADQMEAESIAKHREEWALGNHNQYGRTFQDLDKSHPSRVEISGVPNTWYLNPERYLPVNILETNYAMNQYSSLMAIKLNTSKPRNLDRSHVFKINEGYREYTIITDLNPEYFQNGRGWLETYAAYVYANEADYIKSLFNVMEMSETDRVNFIMRYYGDKYHYNRGGGDELSIGGYSTGGFSCMEYSNFIQHILAECGITNTGILAVRTKTEDHALVYGMIDGQMKYLNPTWLLGGQQFAHAMADSPDEAIGEVKDANFKATCIINDDTIDVWSFPKSDFTWEMID